MRRRRWTRRRSPRCAPCPAAGCSTPRRKAASASTACTSAARASSSRATSSPSPARSCWSKRRRRRSLALRRFDLEGTDTLPPVGDSVQRARAAGRRPAHRPGRSAEHRRRRRAAPARARAAQPLELRRLGDGRAAARGARRVRDARAHRARPAARPTPTSKSVGGFSWQSASSVFVFPGEHTLRAERKGYEPAEVQVKVGGPAPAHALIHLVKLPGKLKVDTRRRRRRDLRRRRAARPRAGRRSTCRPAIARSRSRRRAISITSSASPSPAAARSRSSRSRSSRTSASSPSARVPAGAQIEVDGKPAGVTPAKVEMDSGIRRVQVVVAGPAPVDVERRGHRGHARRPSGPSTLGAADAHVTVRSVPSGAQVTTGGSFRGITPVTIDLSPGVSHAITRRARRLRAVDARGIRRSRTRRRRSMRASPRCWSTCASRASPRMRKCS